MFCQEKSCICIFKINKKIKKGDVPKVLMVVVEALETTKDIQLSGHPSWTKEVFYRIFRVFRLLLPGCRHRFRGRKLRAGLLHSLRGRSFLRRVF